MSVSNLSGTKWVWNDTPNLANAVASTTYFSVIFTSNETLYDYGIRLTSKGVLSYCYINGGGGVSVQAAYRSASTEWLNGNFKTIEFASNAGTDATTPTLISILETYATQVIEPSASVSILLGNTEIASITESRSVTLATSETFCTSDITIDFISSGNASVTAKLGNVSIATMSSSGSVVLATAGTYVAEDITITYAA